MYEKYIKRLIDIIVSIISLFILLPVILIVALLIRIKLGKPIIFKQKRVGKQESIFDMYKFRSMTNCKDSTGTLLPDSERLTKFGKVLRASSFDELPELINILKGDMSLVGPRPLLVQYIPLYSEVQRHRHDVKPGLTGLAQINGRNAISWETKFQYDVQYTNQISFINDFKIIYKTVSKVLKKEDINFSSETTMEPFKGGL